MKGMKASNAYYDNSQDNQRANSNKNSDVNIDRILFSVGMNITMEWSILDKQFLIYITAIKASTLLNAEGWVSDAFGYLWNTHVIYINTHIETWLCACV